MGLAYLQNVMHWRRAQNVCAFTQNVLLIKLLCMIFQEGRGQDRERNDRST